MLSKKQRQRELACAEDISLLSILSPPSYSLLVNKPPFLKSQPDSSRVLPFETEVSLASTLAFLSGISDDPSHVVAASVEELGNGNGICVRVAINKDHAGGGDDVLERIQDGLQRVLKCLAPKHTDSDDHTHDQTLTAILDMSQPRLLSRLGVQRAGIKKAAKDRSFFGSPIQQIINAVSQYKYTKKVEAEARRFIKLAGELLTHLEQLKTCKVVALTACFKRVTYTSSQLIASIKFDKLFSALNIDPLMKTGFVTRLGKIARYYESSHFLVQLAKRSILFDHTEVTTIKLNEEAFLRVPNSETIHRLSECLSRCHPGAPLPLNINKICQKVKTDPTTANAVFGKATRKILAESKVHAEVQIVAYYGLHPVARKPRVICSNKDACYMCNLFIQVHGMYYVPKSHGRLYTGWRVPPISSLNDAHAQLDKALQNKIRDVVQEFKDFGDRERVLDLNQNESTIFPFTTLMSSLESISLPVAKPPQAGQVQKPPRPPQRLHEPPQRRLPERPQSEQRQPEQSQEQPQELSPATTQLSKPHIVKTSTPRIERRDERITDQQPTIEPTSSTSKSSSTPVFSPTLVAPSPEDLPSPPRPKPPVKQDTPIPVKTLPKPTLANLSLLDQQSPDLLENQKPTRQTSRTSSEPAEVTPSLPTKAQNSRGSEGKRVESSEQKGKVLLQRGKTTGIWMDEGVLPPVFTAGGLDIFLENVTECKRGRKRGSTGKVVRVDLTWLGGEGERRPRMKRGRNYHFLEGLERGMEVDGGSGEVVVLEGGGEVVVVEVVGEGRGKGVSGGKAEWA
ncbi:uncharacterized protein PODANS_1_6800 [Podospora anserina S mat+]|uniref:Podospora anserina S mat+ genomic DNA chromosome 1, supercontig 1 n=1 Tax=Podospora anserina (strain S / ATCC MYA-4624 / DSM 980 / FGSC 10383) TaxID=515849 RepID=B2ABB9_PODAN|nr:uncharacterized protein PODANS_1_6800 [Podospora anserina S mat+]CAP60381.1 unnamed protein product [Podospora anserina S mat+]CDP23020.1 Putative protein of unknown function [Podospora anserina S mat+]